jgi:hypothetical protein
MYVPSPESAHEQIFRLKMKERFQCSSFASPLPKNSYTSLIWRSKHNFNEWFNFMQCGKRTLAKDPKNERDLEFEKNYILYSKL